MNIEEKLESFLKKVMTEASQKNLKIMDEIDAEQQRELVEAQQRELRKAEEAIRAAEHKAVQMRERAAAAAALESKKALIVRRNQMLCELFEGTERRLEAFTCSPEYADYLRNAIRSLAERYSELTIHLRSEDMTYASMISDTIGVNVQPSPDNFLGGFIASTAKRGILDKSFKSRLEQERERFSLELIK